MKKAFFTLLILVTSLVSASAADDVNRLVLQNFKADFKYAKNVTWTTRPDFIKAKFTEMDIPMEAFYSISGDLIGVSQAVSLENLPAKVPNFIAAKYPAHRLSEVIEFYSVEEGISYYISAESNDEKLILQATTEGTVTVFKRMRK